MSFISLSFMCLGDVLQHFALAVYAIATLTPVLARGALPRNRHQVVVGIDPGVGKHPGHLLGVHVADELMPGVVELALNDGDVVGVVTPSPRTGEAVVPVHFPGHGCVLSKSGVAYLV
jgi:hypothetical protein